MKQLRHQVFPGKSQQPTQQRNEQPKAKPRKLATGIQTKLTVNHPPNMKQKPALGLLPIYIIAWGECHADNSQVSFTQRL